MMWTQSGEVVRQQGNVGAIHRGDEEDRREFLAVLRVANDGLYVLFIPHLDGELVCCRGFQDAEKLFLRGLKHGARGQVHLAHHANERDLQGQHDAQMLARHLCHTGQGVDDDQSIVRVAAGETGDGGLQVFLMTCKWTEKKTRERGQHIGERQVDEMALRSCDRRAHDQASERSA